MPSADYTPSGSVGFQEIVEFSACNPCGSVKFQEFALWRLYPLWKFGIPGIRGSQRGYTPRVCTTSGSLEFYEIVEVRRLHPTRLHPLCKSGIPGNRGSQAVTPHALAPLWKCGIP